MLTIEVRTREARARTALVTVRDGRQTIAEDAAVASATPEIARAHDNPECDPPRPFGHPPEGTYLLIASGETPASSAIEYGSDVLVFVPRSGPALEAESFGRLRLLVYAGPPGADGRLRRTQGGVRLTDRTMRTIVSRLDPDVGVELRIRPLPLRPWWAFWRRAETTSPLSSAGPRLVAPVLDEGSLVEQLRLHTVRRAARPLAPSTEPDETATASRSSSSSRTTEGEPPFRGEGGRFGGAGASGSWEEPASPTGRRPGVDAAGRIVEIAVAAAAAAALSAAGDTETPTDAPTADSEPPEGDADIKTGTTY